MRRLFNSPKILIALLLLVVGFWVTINDLGFRNQSVSTSFSDEPVTIAEFELSEVPEQDKPRRILIPNLNIDLDVRESKVVRGYWEVYDLSAGWGEGSSPPGYNGNQVIFAHAREGLFGSLNNITVGESIYVFNENRWYSYEVDEIEEVYPGKTEVIKQTDNETLTLYTCSGYRDEKRLIVKAKRTI